MCEYCEKDKKELGFDNGIQIELGVGSMIISNYIGKHPYSGEYQLYHQIIYYPRGEKSKVIEDEEYYPWNKVPYIGINYCPFCGRNLKESE